MRALALSFFAAISTVFGERYIYYVLPVWPFWEGVRVIIFTHFGGCMEGGTFILSKPFWLVLQRGAQRGMDLLPSADLAKFAGP